MLIGNVFFRKHLPNRRCGQELPSAVLLCAVGELDTRPRALLKPRPQIDDESIEPLTDERGPAAKSPLCGGTMAEISGNPPDSVRDPEAGW
jgi:hypothetical protein